MNKVISQREALNIGIAAQSMSDVTGKPLKDSLKVILGKRREKGLTYKLTHTQHDDVILPKERR